MQAVFIKYYKVVFVMLVMAIAILSFYVGMLKGREVRSGTVSLNCDDALLEALAIPKTPFESQDQAQKGTFVGSKNGTKYYTSGCSALERIKPENRVWFKTKEDATLQGYTPADC